MKTFILHVAFYDILNVEYSNPFILHSHNVSILIGQVT